MNWNLCVCVNACVCARAECSWFMEIKIVWIQRQRYVLCEIIRTQPQVEMWEDALWMVQVYCQTWEKLTTESLPAASTYRFSYSHTKLFILFSDISRLNN